MADRFIGWVIEKDGSLTAACETDEGEAFELRGCSITEVNEGAVSGPGLTVTPMKFVRTGETGA